MIFDFDGTLSWLRHGWPEIMLDLFEPYLAGTNESWRPDRDELLSDILSLNGKPTIYQMKQFAERVTKAGSKCPSPDDLLTQYQSHLDATIEERSRKVLSGKGPTDEFVIFGARPLLERLTQRGVTLIILSGTIEHRVKEEARLLDLARYFGNHIYGSTPDPTQFSKRQVIDRILREENIQGEHLLSFGDGPIEIAETKAVGGLAAGVASDENENGSGRMDPFKQEQLARAGADLLIPDYRDPDKLLTQLL